MTNLFYPQQKLLSKQRQGAKVIKKYDVATTPYSRATGRKEVTAAAKERLVGIDAELNPAALQRQVQAPQQRAAQPHHLQEAETAGACTRRTDLSAGIGI